MQQPLTHRTTYFTRKLQLLVEFDDITYIYIPIQFGNILNIR